MNRRRGAKAIVALALVISPLVDAAVDVGQVRAGQQVVMAVLNPRDTMPRADEWAVVAVVLSLGSDPGTMCYEVRDSSGPDSGPPNSGNQVVLGTGPLPELGFPPSSIVASLGFVLDSGVSTGCVTGLDQALIDDLFTKPFGYWVGLVSVSIDLPSDLVLAASLNFPGAQCVVNGSPPSVGVALEPGSELLARIYVYPQLPVEIWGSGFMPRATVEIAMAPEIDMAAVRTFTLAVDDFGRIDLVIPPPHDFTPGWWLFSAPGTPCAGPTWPAAAGGSGAPAGPLPDTAVEPTGAAFAPWAIAIAIGAGALAVRTRSRWHRR